MSTVTRADVCAAAIADAFSDDGEIFASPMGLLPMLGVRLAKLTSNPDLVISDGESLFLAGVPPLFAKAEVVEGWIPFRRVFEVVAYGKRHVMMGATQVDRDGNQNISAIGDFAQPKRQLLGSRGAPGNTVNNRTSYWVPRHSPRVFVEQVDIVSGVGPRRARAAGPAAARFNDIHRIVTDLAVLDVGGPDDTVRLLSVHPGVSVDEVVAATGFELAFPPPDRRHLTASRYADARTSRGYSTSDDVPTTREPTPEELILIREVLDPKGLRFKEVPQPASAEGVSP
jgi:acyl CoA:acetate/3-ketoacid CoA transferase beta subunit